MLRALTLREKSNRFQRKGMRSSRMVLPCTGALGRMRRAGTCTVALWQLNQTVAAIQSVAAAVTCHASDQRNGAQTTPMRYRMP